MNVRPGPDGDFWLGLVCALTFGLAVLLCLKAGIWLAWRYG